MGKWNRGALLLAAMGTVAVLGCANPSPQQWVDDQQSSTQANWSGSPDTSNTRSHNSDAARSANASSGSTRVLDKATSTVSSAGRTVSGAFKSATHKVSGALAIKPKVTPAPDSVKLSNMPGQLSPIVFVRGAAFSESKGNMAGAQQQYEKALELDPNNVTTLIAYARFRDRIGDSNQAVEVYQRARTVQPNNATIWNDLALCHARRGEVESALGAMQRTVALKPDNVRYRNNLAAVLVQADRPEDAVREIQKVHSPAEANHNVACLLIRLRNRTLAAEYLRRAVSLDPSLQRARTLLARLDEAGANAPRDQRGDTWTPTVTPPDRRAEPQLTNAPSNDRNLRTSPWEPVPRDASYGSYRQSDKEQEAIPHDRFPPVEPPARGDMKRIPAF